MLQTKFENNHILNFRTLFKMENKLEKKEKNKVETGKRKVIIIKEKE